MTVGLRSLRSRERGSPSCPGPNFFGSGASNWLKLALFSHFFAFVAHFLVFLTHLGFFHRFVLIVIDFSSIFPRFGEGFREGFSMIFDTFFETCQNVWKSTKHCVGAWILKVDSYKNKQILPQNCKKNDANLRPEKNKPQHCSKNLIWEGLGLHLGRLWGKDWAGFWPGLDEEFEGFAASQCMFPESFW